MSSLTATIPLSKIKKLEIYVAKCKMTLGQVQKATGADYIINGGLFNSDGSCCPLLKVNGIWRSKIPWSSYGFGWKEASDLCMEIGGPNDNPKSNFICTTPMVVNGTNVAKMSYTSDMGGARPRTAFGTDTSGNLRLYITSDSKTPEQLRDIMTNYHCTNSMMLDGGGSVQGYFNGEVLNVENRKCHNYICVYLKDDAKLDPDLTPKTNEEVKDTGNQIIPYFITKNPCYSKKIACNKRNMMLHSTGTPGAGAKAFANNMNSEKATTSVEFIIDTTGIYQLLPVGVKSWHCGKSANNTHVACELCEPIEARCIDVNWYPLSRGGKNNTTWAVTALQKELKAWGYDPNGIDGSFGPGCETALKKFQSENGLTADGSAGPATLKKMRTRKGCYLDFTNYVESTKAFFENEYNKAVWLFAKILKQLGSDSTKIISHQEGFVKNIASNHADVGHWFPYYGKTMDDFRADVKKAMGAGIVSDTTTITNSDTPDTWAKESWDKAKEKNIIDGTRPKDYITRQEVVCILDRLNLL